MKIAGVVAFASGLLTLATAQGTPRNHSSQVADSAPSIGIEVGQRAPAFSLPDQFGHEESNETLKGSNGTVLLFFRSADW